MPANKDALLALNDWLKQIIALSSGATVLVATLLDKFAGAHYYRIAVKLAIGAFILSTICGVFAMLLTITRAYDSDDTLNTPIHTRITMINAFLSPVFMVVGLLSLVVFVCNNF